MHSERQTFVFCYDYGMGGLWGFISAPSREAVKAEYPELTLFDGPPPWMTPENESLLLREEHDLEGAPWGIINTVLQERAAGRTLPRDAWPVFLVGKGDPLTGKGRWLFVRARNEPHIVSQYPELIVVHGKQPWSSQGVRDGSISNDAAFIDVPPTGLLAEILEDRSGS
jgi:hypothetical protein